MSLLQKYLRGCLSNLSQEPYLSLRLKFAKTFVNTYESNGTLFYLTTLIHSSLRPFSAMAGSTAIAVIPICLTLGSSRFSSASWSSYGAFIHNIQKVRWKCFPSARRHLTSDRHLVLCTSKLSKLSEPTDGICITTVVKYNDVPMLVQLRLQYYAKLRRIHVQNILFTYMYCGWIHHGRKCEHSRSNLKFQFHLAPTNRGKECFY